MKLNEADDAALRAAGDLLRQERESRGLSIDDVVQESKISRRTIEALEAGDKRRLPHPVYVKGFVKTYAAILGLEPDEFITAVEDAYQSERAEEENGGLGQLGQDKAPVLNAPSRRWPLFLVLGVLLLSIFVGGWYLFGPTVTELIREGLSTDPVVSPTAPEAPDVLTEGVTEAAPDEPVETAPAANSDEASGAGAAPGQPAPGAPEDGATPGTPEGDGGAAVQANATAAATAGATETAAETSETAEEGDAARPRPGPAIPAGPGETSTETAAETPATESAAPETAPAARAEEASDGVQTVTVSAFEACWVESKSDDTIVKDFYLRPGESAELRFKKTLVLRLGNAGGVTVTHNGAAYTLQAESGDVKVLHFPPKD